MIEIKENELTVEEYLRIRQQVGWKKLKKEQAERALQNSLLVVAVYKEDTLVGMGRIVGDGAVICYVQDLIVVPGCQGNGIGSTILKRLTRFVESLRQEDSEMMFCLMCAKGRETFYEKHGFIARPTDTLGPGMIQYL
jgi:GNAT superfamily N-acetyltransferase